MPLAGLLLDHSGIEDVCEFCLGFCAIVSTPSFVPSTETSGLGTNQRRSVTPEPLNQFQAQRPLVTRQINLGAYLLPLKPLTLPLLGADSPPNTQLAVSVPRGTALRHCGSIDIDPLAFVTHTRNFDYVPTSTTSSIP